MSDQWVMVRSHKHLVNDIDRCIETVNRLLVSEHGRKLEKQLLQLKDTVVHNERHLAHVLLDLPIFNFTLSKLRVDTSTPRDKDTVNTILGLLPVNFRYNYCGLGAEKPFACACSGCCNPWVTEAEYRTSRYYQDEIPESYIKPGVEN